MGSAMEIEKVNYEINLYEDSEAQGGPTCPSDPLIFPEGIIDGVAGQFALLYSEHLEVPTHFFYMAFLTCLGSVLSKRLTLNSEIRPQPRIFLLLLGGSAEERKSTAIAKTIDFFRETINDFRVCFGVNSAEGLQKLLTEPIILCFDEFKQFVSKCKIETSVLLSLVNTLFESNRYEAHTKSNDISIDSAYLSLLAASTIDTYERTWDSSFTDIGFNNRLFLVPGRAERKFSFPSKIDDNDKSVTKRNLGEILGHVGTYRELSLTQDARDLYHKWYLNLEKSIHTKRLDTYALRFMALLAVNELKNEVDVSIVKKVISLMDWQYQVRQQHDPIDADTMTAKMEEKIRRVLKRKASNERELKQLTNANRSGLFIFRSALQNLKSACEIKWNKGINKYELR